MKKAVQSSREAESNPASIRTRIQTLLKEKEGRQGRAASAAKPTAPHIAVRMKDEPAGQSVLEDSFSTSISPLNRSFTPKSRAVKQQQSGAATTKSVNRSFNFAAKHVNLRISRDKKAVLPLPGDPADAGEKETIVSVLNSTVPSPQKAKEMEIEFTVRRIFQCDNLRLVRRELTGARMPRTVLVLQGAEWKLYDVVE